MKVMPKRFVGSMYLSNLMGWNENWRNKDSQKNVKESAAVGATKGD